MTRFLTRSCFNVPGTMGDEAILDGPGPATADIRCRSCFRNDDVDKLKLSCVEGEIRRVFTSCTRHVVLHYPIQFAVRTTLLCIAVQHGGPLGLAFAPTKFLT